MLWSGRLYFLSDRSGVMNIWSMRPDGSDKRAVTAHTCFGVTEATVGEDGVAVYRSGASLFKISLGAGEDAGMELDIALLTDRAQMQEHWVHGEDWLSWASVSPDGSQVALISRGVLFTAPVHVGERKRQIGSRLVQVAPGITAGGGQRFEATNWINSTHILAVADTAPAGELGFFITQADGLGDLQEVGLTDSETVSFGRGGHEMVLSPDHTLIAWTDHQARLWLAPFADPTNRTLLAEGATFGQPAATFSPDGSHIAINMNNRANMAAIWLYKIATETAAAEGPTQLTEGHSNCWSPVWTPSALFFLSDRELRNEVGSPWGSRGSLPKFASEARIYAIPLRAEATEPLSHLFVDDPTELSPWPTAGERFNCTADAPFTTTVDFGAIDALRKRVRVVPTVHSSDLSDLASFSCGSALLFTQERDLMAVSLTEPFSEPSAEPFTVAKEVRSFEVTPQGALMTMSPSRAVHVGVASSVGGLRSFQPQKPAGTDAWMVGLQPAAEWQQLYRDAWRMMRDYFWCGTSSASARLAQWHESSVAQGSRHER